MKTQLNESKLQGIADILLNRALEQTTYGNWIFDFDDLKEEFNIDIQELELVVNNLINMNSVLDVDIDVENNLPQISLYMSTLHSGVMFDTDWQKMIQNKYNNYYDELQNDNYPTLINNGYSIINFKNEPSIYIDIKPINDEHLNALFNDYCRNQSEIIINKNMFSIIESYCVDNNLTNFSISIENNEISYINIFFNSDDIFEYNLYNSNFEMIDGGLYLKNDYKNIFDCLKNVLIETNIDLDKINYFDDDIDNYIIESSDELCL